MKKHKLYMTNDTGSFNGYDQKKVWIDTKASELSIEKIKIPFAEIVACELRPLPIDKGSFLAIDICGPSVNNSDPTTIMLIHKNFFGITKNEPMQEVVDELKPLIENNIPPKHSREQTSISAGKLKAQYTLNVSLLIALYQKKWYNYDCREKIIAKTILLMLIGGVVNVMGILLILVPFDNYKMSRNLLVIGWSKRSVLIAYVITTIPAYALWTYSIIRWTIDKG
jgi:hypothetical protein